MTKRLYCAYTSVISDSGKWLVILRDVGRSEIEGTYKELRIEIFKDHNDWFMKNIKKHNHKKISTKYSLRKIKEYLTSRICRYYGYYYIMPEDGEYETKINIVDILMKLMAVNRASIINTEKIISGFLDDD